MKAVEPVLVVDTSALVRGVLNPQSASGEVMRKCLDGSFELLLSRSVLNEYREVLAYTHLTERKPELTHRSVALILIRLRYVGQYFPHITRHFHLPRDPRDEKFIELAIMGRPNFLVTYDNDLLALAEGHDETAKRFRRLLPGIRLLNSEDFLAAADS